MYGQIHTLEGMSLWEEVKMEKFFPKIHIIELEEMYLTLSLKHLTRAFDHVLWNS